MVALTDVSSVARLSYNEVPFRQSVCFYHALLDVGSRLQYTENWNLSALIWKVFQ